MGSNRQSKAVNNMDMPDDNVNPSRSTPSLSINITEAAIKTVAQYLDNKTVDILTFSAIKTTTIFQITYIRYRPEDD